MRLSSACNWLMAVLFCVSAALQYNDPDPLSWIALYAAAAAACALWGLRRVAWPGAAIVAAPVAAIAVAWAALLLPDVLGHIGPSDLFLRMSEKGGRVEVGREIGGLLIVIAWMLVLLVIEVLERRRQRA